MAVEFSKKSMENLTEPDRLDTYIRVATPGAWLILAAVALAIITLAIWGMLGQVDGVTVFDALFH